jgi:raffinose/stachyose/melibiose transport system permease protein
MTAQERRNLFLHLFTLPAIILIAVYLYYPIFDNAYLSLFDIRNFNLQQGAFVGFENYSKLFRDPIFWRAMRNTVVMLVATVFIQLPIAFLLADALANHVHEKHRRLEAWLLLFLFIPVVMPTPVLAKTWRLFFTGMHGAGYGPFEWMAVNFGIEEEITQFLGTETVLLLGEVKIAFWVVVAVQTWARIGFNLLIYRSAILSIPAEIYESAEIDGAGPWTKLLRITIPLGRNVIGATIVLAILGVFQLFDMVWLITAGGGLGGGPLNTTHLLATYMYTRAFVDLRTGYGAAIAITILVAALSLSFIQRRLFPEST